MKTDNDHVATKLALRVHAVTRLGDPRPIRVLDAYHGHGRLWDETKAMLPEGWTVKVLGIDKEVRSPGTLRGDNLRIMGSLDLAGFDLIDLDAYGWPVEQLQLVARTAPDVPVLSTRISFPVGPPPLAVTDALGMKFITGTEATALMAAHGDELWEAWLYSLGYRNCIGVRFAGAMVKRYELLDMGAPTPEKRPTR